MPDDRLLYLYLNEVSMLYGSISNIGDHVSRLVLGTGSFAPERLDDIRPVFQAFLAAGGTTFDTAHVYGRGASERALGELIRERGGTDGLVIVDKGAHPSLDDWLPRVTPEALLQDLEESLDRLGITTIDLYLLHRDDPTVPVGPLVECLSNQVVAGRIRAFGGSNWTPSRIDAANAYAAAHGLPGFVASSPQFSLAFPTKVAAPGGVSLGGDHVALEWYRRNGLAILCWSSQAKGYFALPEEAAPGDVPDRLRPFDTPANRERRDRARELARRHRCTPTQIALAWHLHQPIKAFPIVGTGRQSHLEDCLGALEVPLTAEEVGWLEQVD